MEKLVITTQTKSYPIYIGDNLHSQLYSIIKDSGVNLKKILLISDSQIAPLYSDEVKSSFPEEVEIFEYVVPSGEQSKSFDEYYKILTFALEKGLDRKSAIFALGGGVIGDLAGFIAATFMRGIKFYQLPTTLLAHDSSVGGKVGINHTLGKNMVGAFYQPDAVIYDVSTLNTLDIREWRSGFAEVMKHGLLSGTELFEWIKSTVTELPITNLRLLENVLKKAIEVKAIIVENDEKEAGIRAHLNLGHTLGHAIEANLGYGKITHGEGVAIGMIFAMRLSNELLDAALPVQEIASWYKTLSLPIALPDECTIDELIDYMKRDKKSEYGQINMVLLQQIGQPIRKAVDETTLRRALQEFAGQPLQ